MAALLSGFLSFLITGETFESKDLYKAKLQGFALKQGFTVVIGKFNKDGTSKIEFLCIHYGCVSWNDRRLKEEV